MNLVKYWSSNSWIHRMDPRAKLLFVLEFLILVFLANHLAGYSILFLIGLIGMFVSSIPLRFFIVTFKPILFLVLITVIMNLALFKGGSVLFDLGYLQIYENGLNQALIVSVRIILVSSMILLLTFTTSPLDLTIGIESLLKPLNYLRFPVSQFALFISISLRFIPILGDEINRIKRAQMARGIDFECSHLLKKIYNYISIVVPLIISVLRRSEELAMAMEARCYRLGLKRTRLRELHYQPLDAILILVSVLLITSVWFLKG